MVYCGKPSRGCQCCKSRKIKCDEVRPACGQCLKSNRTCPGYPDEFDLVLRNETTLVKEKVHGKGGRRKGSKGSPKRSPASDNASVASDERWETTSTLATSNRSRQSSQSSSDSPHTFLSSSTPNWLVWEHSPSFSQIEQIPVMPVFQTLELPSEVRATAFFFRNFILLPQQSTSMRGFLEYLVPMYYNASADSPLELATHSVAMAILSRYSGNTHLIPSAFAKYGAALKKVNAALLDPVDAKTDETLLCVLLFGLYEAMTSVGASSSAWNKHVDGAVALVKMRGTDQLQNQQSLNLFRAVRTAMLTSCIQRGLPVQDFPDPKGWCCDDEEEQNAANSLTLKSFCLPELGTRAKNLLKRSGEPGVKDELLDVIRLAKDADAGFELWALSLPESWSPKTVTVINEIPQDLFSAEAWIGELHIYEDLFVANITNDYRVSRIFCHSIIASCARAVDPDGIDAEMMATTLRSQFIVQKMVEEISSSVPFHMQYSFDKSDIEAEAAQAIGGYFLLWPLFVCSQAKTLSDAHRVWLHGRICAVAKVFGLSPQEIELMAKNHVLTSGPAFLSV